MRTLLLNPMMLSGICYMKEISRCGRKSITNEIWPQTGLAYLAAVLKENGMDVKIIDAMADKSTLSDILNIINSYKPEILVIHTTTPTFYNDAKVAEIIRKEIDTKIVIGFVGTHVTVLPKESLENSVADFVIIGEGEHTLLDVVKGENWQNIPGLGYRSNEKIYINQPREFIDYLDTLPFPARELLPNYAYRMPFFGKEPFVTVIPSRGCPYQCIFCRAGKVWGRKIRLRSVKNVLSEIEHITSDLKINNIVFMTDALTLDKKWLIQLCNEIIERKLAINWIANSRVDSVDKEMLLLMKKAGCKLISYGVESGNQSILDRAKKRIRLEQSEQAIRWTKEAGIIAFAYFILGLPGENWDTIHQTIDFAIKLDPDYVNFHIATPFPGTELYELAKKNNWLITDDWSKFEEQGSAVLNTEYLTAEELIKAQKIAMRKFYMRPRRLFKELFRPIPGSGLKYRIKAGLKIFLEV